MKPLVGEGKCGGRRRAATGGDYSADPCCALGVSVSDDLGWSDRSRGRLDTAHAQDFVRAFGCKCFRFHRGDVSWKEKRTSGSRYGIHGLKAGDPAICSARLNGFLFRSSWTALPAVARHLAGVASPRPRPIGAWRLQSEIEPQMQPESIVFVTPRKWCLHRR